MCYTDMAFRSNCNFVGLCINDIIFVHWISVSYLFIILSKYYNIIMAYFLFNPYPLIFLQIATLFWEMHLFHLRSRLYIARMAFVSCQDILVLESCKRGYPASSSLVLKLTQPERRTSKIPSKKKPS